MSDDVERVRNNLPALDRYATTKANSTTTLRKESGELRGENPWHGSSTGNNFAVDPDSGQWYCHSKGCKAGGGILEYIAVDEGIVGCGDTDDLAAVFPEVLEVAAEIAGVDLDMGPRDRASVKERREEQEALDAVYEAAAAYYNDNLDIPVPDPDEGDRVPVAEYMHRHYGLTRETLDDALVGFAPPDDRALLDFLDVGDRLALKSGLAVKTQDGVVDFYDGRIMFPYFYRDTPRYFIGRKTPLTPDVEWEKGKYKKMLTPGSKDYVSSLVDEPIYGRDGARRADEVIVTEGVTDVLAAGQHGYTAIAPVTTSFKEDRVQDVARLVRNARVTVIMDEDPETNAGVQGAIKTAKVLDRYTDRQTEVRVARLPLDEGDLCDYLRQKGGDI